MCLTVDEGKTRQIKKSLNSWEKIPVWKVYAVKDGTVTSPLHGGDPINCGYVLSNRPVASYPFLPDSYVSWKYDYPADCDFGGTLIEINPGIHVCFSREAARKYKRDLESEKKADDKRKFVIFRGEASVGDLVAAGYSEYNAVHENMAVFVKIFIRPPYWQKALKGDYR